MTGMDDLIAAIAEDSDLVSELTKGRRAAWIDNDGTVHEIPPDDDGWVRPRWNLDIRRQLNPDFPG